ncbi:MAG: sugar ABC transporter permease [Rhodoglobus sp.]|nr:sugar ABC transporter permease [Rhodoglobus sp.]
MATAAELPLQPMARARRRRRRINGAAILFAIPGLLAFGYFAWGPIVRGVVMSWQRTNLIDPPTWVGWNNFEFVLQNPVLGQAVLNTVLFMVLSVVLGFPVPLVLAVLISELRHRQLYLALAFLPVVIPPVVGILLWKVFYDPSSSGLFNQVLGVFGIGPLPWLNDANLALPALVIESVWAAAGSTMVIYVAALAGVRTELYEAAELDGAGLVRRIVSVTLPQLRGVILVLLLLQLIGVAQVFAEPFLFTGGGPNNATVTVMLLIYRYAFISGDFGAASALSVMLAVVLALLSLLYLRATRRWSAD